MALIRCSECDREISDKSVACVGCGAPTSPTQLFGDLDGDGKIGLADLRIALERVREGVTSATDTLLTQGKELFKSNEQSEIDALASQKPSSADTAQHTTPESAEACQKFQAALRGTIDVKFAEIMRGKVAGERFLTYVDAQSLTASVRNVFTNALGTVPPQIDTACYLSEMVLSPSASERQRLLKTAAGVGGGAAGIAMVISGAAAALGWGASVAATVTAFFVGTSLAGPFGWVIAGISLAGVAAYFATTSNDQVDTERFMKVLRNSVANGVIAIWGTHESALSKALSREPAR